MHLGAVLRAPWAVLELFWTVWGASWTVLGALLGRPSGGGPSWGPLGPSWGGFGGLVGRRERRESRKVVYARHVRFPQGIARSVFLGALLGVLLEPSGGVLEIFWAIFRPSRGDWVPFDGRGGHCGRPQTLENDFRGARMAAGAAGIFADTRPPPNRPDGAPGGGVWGGAISHTPSRPQGVGG